MSLYLLIASHAGIRKPGCVWLIALPTLRRGVKWFGLHSNIFLWHVDDIIDGLQLTSQ